MYPTPLLLDAHCSSAVPYLAAAPLPIWQVGDQLLSIDGEVVRDTGSHLIIPPASRHTFVLRRTSGGNSTGAIGIGLGSSSGPTGAGESPRTILRDRQSNGKQDEQRTWV